MLETKRVQFFWLTVYIHLINRLNSRNDLCHADSATNIVRCIIIIIIIILSCPVISTVRQCYSVWGDIWRTWLNDLPWTLWMTSCVRSSHPRHAHTTQRRHTCGRRPPRPASAVTAADRQPSSRPLGLTLTPPLMSVIHADLSSVILAWWLLQLTSTHRANELGVVLLSQCSKAYQSAMKMTLSLKMITTGLLLAKRRQVPLEAT